MDELETTVARMTKIGSCYSPSFAPDGSRLAFVSDMTGVPQVWTVATTGGWPELITAFDDQVGEVKWSPDGEWLAVLVAPGGGMNSQIWLVRPDGSELHRITDGGKENNRLGRWTHDSQRLVVASNRLNPFAVDDFLIDIASGEQKLVVQNDGIGTLADITPDNKQAVAHRVASRSDSNLFLVNLESSHEFLLTPHEGPGSFTDARFSLDGSVIYLTSNQERDNIAFAQVKLARDGQPGPIEVLATRDDAELQEFELSHDGKTAALIWNVAGRNEIVFLDLETSVQTPGPPLPAEIAAGLTFSHDDRYLAMTISGSISPNNVWLFDRPSQQFSQLTHTPHAGIKLETLIKPTLEKFTAQDGLELSGWLYLPKDYQQPGPIVLTFHGGPEGQERPAFNSLTQALLGQGIAIFGPNVRGSSGFGKKFGNLDNGELRFNGIKDIKACAEYVIKAGIADPKRIGIMGGSYGGYMTMAGLTEYPELFAAGANMFGIVNFETFFAHTEPWMAAISKIKYGDPVTQTEMLRQLSPIYKIDRVRGATIVLHGANDTNVPVIEAEQVVASLKERGVPVEYVLFPDEGHGFRKTINRIRAAVATVRWFKKYL